VPGWGGYVFAGEDAGKLSEHGAERRTTMKTTPKERCPGCGKTLYILRRTNMPSGNPDAHFCDYCGYISTVKHSKKGIGSVTPNKPKEHDMHNIRFSYLKPRELMNLPLGDVPK
jgi:ssDNA-binding Zn-finger/Zn-ribbon topoisomerase 1